MKTKLFTLLLAVAASVGTMFARTKIGDLYYNLDATNQTAEVARNSSSGEIIIPSSVTYASVTYSVTSIGDWAFEGCTGLTSVTIPNSVTSIGSSAFWDCTGLTSVTIPNSVTSIGSSAFWNCTGLTSVTIGNSVTSIGDDAFSECTGLTSVTIGNSVTSIGDDAFSECTGLTSVTIPNSVTNIGKEAFYHTGLTSVTIPNSVTSIGSYAFDGCWSLTSIYVPCGEMARFKQMLGRGFEDKVKYAPLPYTITISATNGNVTYPQTICDDMSLNATPEYGYHFVKWSDGVTDNPRTIVLTQDTSFTAEFAINTYTITTESSNPQWGTTAGDNSALYLDEVEITATANYGYHFTQWNDGNTQNPRTISVTENTTYTASFAKNTYSISVKSGNTTMGTVSGSGTFEYLDQKQITATANYGYHFTQWNDGNTQNPRTISITEDATYMASFAKNTYTVTTESSNSEWGTTAGGKSALYLDQVEISATPNYGYHFVQWSDSSYVCDNGWGDECWWGHWEYYTNPTRTITIKSDSSLTATFAKNTYTIQTFATDGTVSGGKTYSYLDQCALTVTPNFGFKFTKWSDGNTDNPRTFIVERDSIFTAEIVQLDTIVGQIGDNLTFTLIGDSVTVTGFGNMYDYRQGQSLLYRFRDQVKTITLPEGLVYIGAYMFEGCNQVKEIILPSSVTAIGQGAFQNCTNIRSITCNASQMVTAQSNSFYGLSQYTKVYVPADLEEDYQFNSVWNKMVIEPFGNMYQVAVLAANGTVSGAGQYFYNRTAKLTVTADYGYHFTQWSDGNKNNPRSIVVTSDTTLVAEFAKNTYQVLTSATHGSVESVPTCLYMEQVSLTPIPEPGYVFAQWSDGNTDNPRIATITKDTLFTAEFMLRPCYIALTSSDQSKGSVSVDQTNYPYGSNVTITATPMLGYKLEQWSNGVQDNPYTLTIVSDTTLMAMFVADGGSCGDNINWVFDIVSGTLTFTGSGAMNDYTGITVTPWYKYQTSIKKVVFDSNITHIGAYSFYGCTGITAISIPNNVISIGKYAFAECKNLKSVVLGNALTDLGEAVFYNDYRIEDITCYPISTPNAESNCFFNIEKGYVYLYIQSDAERNYKRDPNWKDFDIKVIGATENAAVTDDVVVDPKADNAEFTWPKEDKASTYTIEITKDGEVFCRLTFASTGQLVGIAFAPDRNGSPAAQYATQVEGGFQFTVTGLNSASKYGFSLYAKDANDQIIKHYQGEFATEGYQDQTPTAIDQIESSSLQGGDRGRLIIKDNQILILRGDHTYTVDGRLVR